MEEIKETGGATIGWGRATFPFATLTVNKYILELNSGIIGNVIFRTSDIISIKAGTGLTRGVIIQHNVAKYSKEIIFKPAGSSAELVKQINQTGFLTNTAAIPAEIEQQIVIRQSSGGFPLKTIPTIAIVLIWNIFFLYDFYSGAKPLGVGAQLGLGFMILTCILLLVSAQVRQMILKPGQTLNGLRTSLFFIMFITGLMFTISFLIPR